jgi:hypothetical protein
MRVVIDDGQALEDASVGGTIEHEIHRPLRWAPMDDTAVAARLAVLSSVCADAPAATPPDTAALRVCSSPVRRPPAEASGGSSPRHRALMPLRQLHDPPPQRHVAVRLRMIAVCAGAHAHDAQQAPHAQLFVDHLAHQRLPGWCAYDFFSQDVLDHPVLKHLLGKQLL